MDRPAVPPEGPIINSRILSVTQKIGSAAHVSTAILECGHWFNFQPINKENPQDDQMDFSIDQMTPCAECSYPEFYKKLRKIYNLKEDHVNGDFNFTAKANIYTEEGKDLHGKLEILRREWQLTHPPKQEGWDYISAPLEVSDEQLDALYGIGK